MRKFVCAIGAGLLALCLGATTAQANVLIGGTRVVFPAKDGEVTVRLTNDNDHPVLVESWIDRGDIHSTPESVDVPFLITPPLFRMEAKKEQSLRIVYTHEQLPADRESLFWLNVLEVPPKPTGAQTEGQNLLQLALRSRLKLFYRPAGLPGDPAKAPAELTWKVVADGKGFALEAHNPTPYYVTITELSLVVGGKNATAELGMVAPLSDLRMPLHDVAQKPAAGSVVSFTSLNDFGASIAFKGAIAP
ncbi:fimbria/pilus periplasmic chaperone [Dyella jiangningensis]|uniref:fimbrial biogenesis chaperone n=1 Tax=Dyella jiangningensis TaxID=1379159 RepID=UPI00240F6777|nr:fimbria/pilus periplasmic chaperone [Dyella jiangningensis]MDG2539547.1 fimbria/pilus periplasmic chaperone [Dyella jiangningensis]